MTVKTSSNRNLHKANRAKKDEFYTQLVDIENELRHYKSQFHGKVVYCNCDDPFESNFFKYFASNFNMLKLKKLIATSYTKSPIVGGQLQLFQIEGLKPDGKQPFKIEITHVSDVNADGAVDLVDVEHLLKHDANVSAPLIGDGDFRSEECIALLTQADIVVTNPPFSLFREYVAQLVEYDKKFLIIGSLNAITYKEVFKLIKENKLWLGYHNGPKTYMVPDSYEQDNIFIGEDGKKYAKMGNTGWYTNLETQKRHEELVLYKKYTSREYPKYDNYKAIEVGKTADIPMDYKGVMGVPITFLDKYNPEQFEILGNDYGIKQGLLPELLKSSWKGKVDRGYIKGRRLFSRVLIKNKKVKQ